MARDAEEGWSDRRCGRSVTRLREVPADHRVAGMAHQGVSSWSAQIFQVLFEPVLSGGEPIGQLPDPISAR